MITELRDEACTLWASGWLAFRRNASKVIPGLDFNNQFPTEGEAEESDSVPLLGEPEIESPVMASSPISVARTSPSVLPGLEIRVIEAAQSPTSDI